jgi:hypothetical protein
MSGRALNLVKDSESSTESQRVAAEFMRVVIAGRRETNEARRVAMQRARMEIDVATACLMHQLEIAAIAENEELGEEEQIDAVRKRLFGDELPG